MNYTHSGWVLLSGLVLAGCQGHTTTAAPPLHPSSADSPRSHPVASANGTEPPAASVPPSTFANEASQCPNPSNHCLDADIVFVAKRGYEGGSVFVEPARRTADANSSGEAQYTSMRNGKTFRSAYAYSSRAANRLQLHVGTLVIIPFNKAQRIFSGPTTRGDAYSTRWWLTRVISIADLDKGYATVAGGHRVASASARLLDHSNDVIAVLSDSEDEHFLTPQHVMIASGVLSLPSRAMVHANVGIALHSSANKNTSAGQYMLTHDGSIVTPRHVYRTRKASTSDVIKDATIFMPLQQKHGIFVAPDSREQALGGGWWTARVAMLDTVKGLVKTHNGYQVALDAIRVVVPN
ncbi:MAG: hypothetical protein H6715_00210 [Myxococcales bacterium]|nr:hypothetical protein [Myxococcales bacterium]MCB9707387.1 hypothetical protein [Myxococcales bacterium]